MSITREQALDCFRSDDLIGMGMEADALRRSLHPERVVSYVIEQPVPCGAAPDSRAESLRTATRMGATDLSLRTDGEPLPLPAAEALLAELSDRHPELAVHGLTATDVSRMANAESLPVHEVLLRLHAAGLRSLSGEDAYLLNDLYRAEAEETLCDVPTWLAVHRTAHGLGLGSDARLTFGLGEPVEARVEHLLALRGLQAETGGFFCFTPVAFSPRHPSPTHRTLDEATATDYLTTLAVARMVLDEIPNVCATRTQGLKVLQMALRFGANDAGAVLLDAHAIQLAGPSNCATEEELRRLIRDAGFTPVQRDARFGTLYLA